MKEAMFYELQESDLQTAALAFGLKDSRCRELTAHLRILARLIGQYRQYCQPAFPFQIMALRGGVRWRGGFMG